jgi:flagellar hook-basal body complex protein FliE
MAAPSIIIRPDIAPGAAADAYGRTQQGLAGQGLAGSDFGGVLSRALHGAADAGKAAEAQSLQAIAGTGDVTQVVTAVARAELALQTTTTIRDRVVQAYQDIMRMPI